MSPRPPGLRRVTGKETRRASGIAFFAWTIAVYDFDDDWKRAKRAQLPLGRFGLPEEIAPTAVLLASDPGGKSVRRTGPRPQLGRRDALMCGGCGGAPLDWAAELVSGPRQRTAVARRIGGLLRRDTVRAITAGWVVSSPTGASVVCRTYDDLVDAVSERSDRPISEVRAHGLADYTNVCHNRLFSP